MNKTVLFLSCIGVSLLIAISIIDPSNSMVWLASTSKGFIALRVVLLVAFSLLLATAPPRAPILRKMIGTLVVIVAAYALTATYQNQMKILDTLSLLEFAAAAGIAVLERRGLEILDTVRAPKQALKLHGQH